jgi:peptidoglycan/xylan/chitin deacetylase (PgdA/CDA1 family)
MRSLVVLSGIVMLLATACATAPPAPEPARAAAPSAPLPEAFRSEDFVVVLAREGDTPESLAAKYLGDKAKSWVIEDYMGVRTLTAGQQVVIPLRPWNPTGVEATGYQLVPILCYHNLGPQPKGRLMLGASQFDQQMRYLKAQGYRVITMSDFVDWLQLKRQLPKRAVVLTFDDGYKAFREYAYPVLKELGFSATLFVYTDYVGAGRNAFTWDELKTLAAEGFDVQAHSKTHGDLRRAAGEPDAQYSARMQAELGDPLKLFQRHLGRSSQLIAYPYGRVDDDLVKKVSEHGYIAAFTVRRQGSPAFVQPLRVHRSQIYSEMSMEDFAKNLNVFHTEDLR